MIRNHFTAAVSGLIVSDVNFSFSCFAHNHGFGLLQVWCPYCVLLEFGIQDTLSYKVIRKMCNTDNHYVPLTQQAHVPLSQDRHALRREICTTAIRAKMADLIHKACPSFGRLIRNNRVAEVLGRGWKNMMQARWVWGRAEF